MAEVTVSKMDEDNLAVVRDNVAAFIKRVAAKYSIHSGRLMDIAPQDHEGARPFFPDSITIETFDIDPKSGCTYIGDLCTYNASIADSSYDFVVCTEVLEHTLQPFDAVAEVERILKPNGLFFLSVPFNLRIHGPLPDCWRFTEHGLRALLKDFELVELEAIETPGRPLMPIHYTAVCRKLGTTSER